MARLIAVANSLVPFSTCLSQAFAGQILFALHGMRTTFHIGVVAKSGNNFEAHAWLCLDGKIILGYLPNIKRFRELSLIRVVGKL